MMEHTRASYPYFDMHIRDGSNISFEQWTGAQSIGFHCHNFFELLIIDKGACTLVYNKVETLLITGDAVLIPPHEEHAFLLSGTFSVYNLQFTLDALDANVATYLSTPQGLLDESKAKSKDIFPDWESMLIEISDFMAKPVPFFYQYDVNHYKQGVMHLNALEYAFLLPLIKHGMESISTTQDENRIIKQKLLGLILMEFQKSASQQKRSYQIISKDNLSIIYKILSTIESNLEEPLNFNKIAEQYAFHPNYLRKLFKEFTGVSPVTYINRLRVMRAYEYMKQQHLNAKEAAEAVGIYDTNYFSRLFKKIMGCPPHEI